MSTVAVTAADGVTHRNYRVDATRLGQPPVDLRLTIQRLYDAFIKGGAELRRYLIVVTNVGTQAASAVQLNVPIPRGLHGGIRCAPYGAEMAPRCGLRCIRRPETRPWAAWSCGFATGRIRFACPARSGRY